ncbi:MAG: hypothetical protein OER82_03900 [Nitrosopumilus sp.]|nr:hypothetical protein [Nitrosopumilus sp.]
MQYFASFQPFEIFDEFNGVPGDYIKSFLISDQINLNKWQATHAANLSNLDSFLGLGTSIIACEQTGRTCFGMEIDPAYVDVIVERFENYAGQKAVKIA